MKLFSIVLAIIFASGCATLPSAQEDIQKHFDKPKVERDFGITHPDSLSPHWRPTKINRKILHI